MNYLKRRIIHLRKKGDCFVCGERVHFARDCRFQKIIKRLLQILFRWKIWWLDSEVNLTSMSSGWWLDSRVTFHDARISYLLKKYKWLILHALMLPVKEL